MKNSRFLSVFMTAILLSFCFLGGCQKASPSSETETEHYSSEESDIKVSMPSDSSSSEISILHTVSGVIADASMNTLTIQAEDGNTYTFLTESAEKKTGKTGILIGNTASVTFSDDFSEETQNTSYSALQVEITDSEDNLIQYTAMQLLQHMTAEQKVRQMFIGAFKNGESILQETPALGGYILFSRDFENRTKDEAAAFIADCQKASDIPLLIGVDEEGGEVNRISKYSAYRSSPFLSPQALFREGGFEQIEEDTKEKCSLLSSLGINVNFAPVCDIAESPNDFIYTRTFAGDAQTTSEYVRRVVTVMKEENIASVLKHFPGYGGSADTHTGLAQDDRSLETFKTRDFLPFQAGIEAGADVILVAHTIVSSIDAEHPASISSAVHRILREDMNFNGIVITDDLAMQGILDYVGDEAALLAIEAGNDLLCCTNYTEQLPAVLNAVSDGRISEERLNESVLRILTLKIRLGLIAY